MSKKIQSEIWNNPYVQNLGILDHCGEILNLNSDIQISKARRDGATGLLLTQMYKEMVDLYLILDKWVEGKDKLIEDRLQKFAEKEKENL